MCQDVVAPPPGSSRTVQQQLQRHTLVPVKSFPSDFWHSGPVTMETTRFIAHWLAHTRVE